MQNNSIAYSVDIDFSGLGMQRLSEELLRLIESFSIRTVNLRNNHLKTRDFAALLDALSEGAGRTSPLESIDVSCNSIDNIPGRLFTFYSPKLVNLNMSRNLITLMPNELMIYSLQNPQTAITVEGNQVTYIYPKGVDFSTIPRIFADSKLDSLLQFRIDVPYVPSYNVNFDSNKTLKQWKNLEKIRVRGDSIKRVFFDGVRALPRSLFELDDLDTIDMPENGFIGTLPSQMCKLKSLRFINLHTNDLTGTFPSECYNRSSLEVIHLTSNHNLHGMIPSNIGQLLPRLQELQVGNTRFGGTITSSIRLVAQTLWRLELDGSDVGGVIPPGMEALQYLTLSERISKSFNPAVLFTMRALHTFHMYLWKDTNISNVVHHLPYSMRRVHIAWACEPMPGHPHVFEPELYTGYLLPMRAYIVDVFPSTIARYFEGFAADCIPWYRNLTTLHREEWPFPDKLFTIIRHNQERDRSCSPSIKISDASTVDQCNLDASNNLLCNGGKFMFSESNSPWGCYCCKQNALITWHNYWSLYKIVQNNTMQHG